MIDRDGGDIVVHCDTCPDELETGTPDWGEAMLEMKSAGWISVKLGDEWTHKCNACAKPAPPKSKRVFGSRS